MYVVHGRFLFLIYAFYIPILLFCSGLGYCKSIVLFPFMIAMEKPSFRYFHLFKLNIVLFFLFIQEAMPLRSYKISDIYRKFRVMQLIRRFYYKMMKISKCNYTRIIYGRTIPRNIA